MKTRLALHVKIISSSLFFASIGTAILIFIVCMLMEKWYIVNHVEPMHIYIFYETAFSMVTVFLFANLLYREIDKNVFAWLFSIPLRSLSFLLEKWAIGFCCMLIVFAVPLWFIDKLLVNLEWNFLFYHVLAPSMFLGNLTLWVTLLSRSTFVGTTIPLFLWGIELISRGMITGPFTLFGVTFGSEHLMINRFILWMWSILFMILSYLLLRKRVRFHRHI